MISKEKLYWGDHPIHRFFDPDTGSGFSVAPDRGACLTELQFRGISVLDGYRNAGELEALHWGKSALLAPFPNRLKDGRYKIGEEEYQFPINDEARGNALHGFALDKPFEIFEEREDWIGLVYSYNGSLPYFPFPFSFRVSYALLSATEFELSMELKNTGSRPMPAGMGWHPYFQLGVPVNSLHLKLPDVERIEIDERMIPTGVRTPFTAFQSLEKIDQTPFDTGFHLLDSGKHSEVVLQFENLRLHYWQESQFPYLQVFIPPARQSIALEPMTCNIDAFNNGDGLRMLEPGEVLLGAAGIGFTPF
ncbi:MAG: hypothetical protein H6563_13140 [Lewinellaceae bacterium]|nr:hypothetical protein [Lewinellaceae bacterium]